MAEVYRRKGALYQPGELRESYNRLELKELGLDSLFDGVYLSSGCGVKKPAPRFFRVLLQARDISPDSAVMVGNDGTCDVEEARAVGLSTVYIRSNLSPREPLPQADHVLGAMDLRQVGRILGVSEQFPDSFLY